MKLPILALVFAALPALGDEPAPQCCYVSKMIVCDETEERFVEDLYNAFLSFQAREILKKGDLKFPAHFAELSPEFAIVGRSFYITPNTLKGFEIAFPRGALRQEGTMLEVACDLWVKAIDWKQGCCLIQLTKDRPNQRPDGTSAKAPPSNPSQGAAVPHP